MARLSLSMILAMLTMLVLVRAPARGGQTGGVEPTDLEQYMVELVNRARAAPAAEAEFFGIGLDEGLPEGTLSPDPRQPVAINCLVTLAARLHTQDLLDNFTDLPPDHRGSDGRDPTQRVDDAGAEFIGGGAAENNAWSSQSGSALRTATVDTMHKLLFMDFIPDRVEVVGRGHRKIILSGERNEIGIGALAGKFGSRTAGICTQDYITSANAFITGVAYHDDVRDDDFYTPGEGIGGAVVRAERKSDGAIFETTTFASGGYSLPVPAGEYDVTASGGGLSEAIIASGVMVAEQNVKVDFVPAVFVPPPPPPPPPAFELVQGLAKLKKDLWSVSLKKVIYSPGFSSYTGDLLDLRVQVDGVDYFDAAALQGGKVKLKADKTTGETVKISITDSLKNKLQIDLIKRALKMTLKNIPPEQFDPTDGDGTVQIAVSLGGSLSIVAAPAAVDPLKPTKAALMQTTGDVRPIDGDGDDAGD